MFVDLRKISEEGTWVHLLKDGRYPAYWEDEETGEDDKSRPARVKILGPHSETLQKRYRKRMAERRHLLKNDPDLSKLSDDEFEILLKKSDEFIVENLVDATADWENIPGPDGKPMEFSPENAFRLYSKYPQIVAQLKKEVTKINDFFGSDAKS